MADERVVAVKLEQIEQFHGELTQRRDSVSRSKFLESTIEQRAVERMFENVIQACADLAQHIATHDFGYQGSTSKGAVRILHREGVIDEQTMTTLVTAIGFRNVLAHEYGHIDAATVYETLQTGLEVYDTYSQQVASWIQTQE